MNLQTTLTKENFWNEMMRQYPRAAARFCKWIDEYKKAVEWDMLFANTHMAKKIKFHDIPHAMQQGIWIEFARQELDEHFEQPEYYYDFDLEENIKTVFSELEKAFIESEAHL